MTNSRTFRRRLVALLVALCTLPVVAQAQRPTVFIGPQVRDGFLDMDAGIRDSIQDLQARARDAGFQVVPLEADAVLVLIVLGRGNVPLGSVGTASTYQGTGFGLVVPVQKNTLSTLLRVKDYERLAQTAADTSWRGLAEKVIDDLDAWWEANAATVQSLP